MPTAGHDVRHWPDTMSGTDKIFISGAGRTKFYVILDLLEALLGHIALKDIFSLRVGNVSTPSPTLDVRLQVRGLFYLRSLNTVNQKDETFSIEIFN